jgi:hypothetical protein
VDTVTRSAVSSQITLKPASAMASALPQRHFDSDDSTASEDSDTSLSDADNDANTAADSDGERRDWTVVQGASPGWPDHVTGLVVVVGIVTALRFNPEWWFGMCVDFHGFHV